VPGVAARDIVGEITASILVAAHSGATEIVVRDPPGSPVQVHDFDLLMPDGRVLALEVTTAANEGAISQRSAIGKRDWVATKLADSWTISLPQVGGGPGADIRKLRKKVEARLAMLEEHGHDWFGGRPPEHDEVEDEGVTDDDPPREVQEVIEALRGLGVIKARRLRDTGETVIWLAASGIHATSPQAVNRAVEPLAQDNAAKLLKAEADERHIFVWIDSTIHGADLMINDDLAPETDGIHTAWVARRAIRPEDPVSRLWRVTPPGGWEILVGKAR
jgi:hypothetical protein